MKEILDAIMSQFTGPVTIPMILLSLVCSFLIAMFIIFVYRQTFAGIVYNKTMPLTILLLAMVTAMIIRTINSNLSLSLGMVGALSIVRFRTAIKEPVDTAFMFWAITGGIMCGAGLYVIGIIGSLLLGVAYYFFFFTQSKAKSQFLLVVVYQQSCEAEVLNILKTIPNKRLKNRSINSQLVVEVTYEIDYKKETDRLMNAIQAVNGVRNVNLVSYNSDYGL